MILDHFIAEFGPGEIVEAVASAVADDDVFGIDSADTLSGNVVALPMDVIRSALKAKVGANRWAQEIDAFKDENSPLSSAYSHAAGDPGEVAAAIVRRAKETKTTYHK